MITAILVSSSLVALILLVWFRSEAYIEYCRFFHLDFISHYKEYDEKKKNDISLTYHEYLRQYHNGFKTRLVTCPICVAVWLSILSAILFGKLALMPIAFVGGLLLFGVIHKLLY